MCFNHGVEGGEKWYSGMFQLALFNGVISSNSVTALSTDHKNLAGGCYFEVKVHDFF